MQIISVAYGHGKPDSDGKLSASGKLYDYPTDKQYRVGDVVVVPVEHHKSHKLYNTLAVVRLTSKESSPKGMQKLDYLTDPKNNIKPKNTEMRLEIAEKNGLNVENDRQVTVKTLPGYENRLSKAKWSRADRQDGQEEEKPTGRILSRIK